MEITKEELQAKIDEAVKGLKDKNDELLSKLKKSTDTLSEFADIDIAGLKESSKQLKKLKEDQMTDKERLDKDRQERVEIELKRTQELSDARSTIDKMRKETAVSASLLSLGTIKEGMEEAVELLLNNKVTIVDDKALIGDKPVQEYVKAWAEADGKAFFTPKNSGGGGNGGGSGSNAEIGKFFDKESKTYNLTEQIKLSKTNPELYKQMKSQYS